MSLETTKRLLKYWEEKGNKSKVEVYQRKLDAKLRRIEALKNNPASPYFKYNVTPDEPKEEPKEVKKDGKKPKGQ